MWRCKTEKGSGFYSRNGRVRYGLVVVDGEEILYPQGRYELRYYNGRKQQVFEDAGENATDAEHQRQRMALKLVAKATAEAAGVKLEEETTTNRRRSLLTEFSKFIESMEDRGKMEAAEVYRTANRDFIETVGKRFVDEVTKEDLEKYERRLRDQGYSDRAIHNCHSNVRAFLIWLELDVKKLAKRRPQYEKTIPEVYSNEEIAALFAATEELSQTLHRFALAGATVSAQ